MSTVIKNPIPKARFQESSDNIKRHRDLVQTREFERACDYAMLQLQADVIKQVDNNPSLAGAAFFRLQGAQEYLWQLRNVSESIEVSAIREKVANLDHTK